MTKQHIWPVPRVAQVDDFLPPDEHRALLDWVLSNRELFRPSKLFKDKLDPNTRVSMTTRKLGPLRERLEQRMLEVLPTLEEGVGSKPGTTFVELELAAHGDGAHYARHVDIFYGEDREPDGDSPDRVLSAVYYFHREPKGFSGGALRLYRFNVRPSSPAAGPDDYVEIEPLHNRLIAFVPWATHEVRPIRCPSAKFEDYRFALNCWFCRKR